MESNPTVNRYLKDKAFDYIDHALGRPVDPLRESSRNYFYLCSGESDLAAQFRASPNWREGKGWDETGVYFYVTDEGRKALAAHLKEIGDKARHFVVTIKDWDDRPYQMNVVATSHSQARYRAFMRLEDVSSCLTFRDFVTRHLGSTSLAKGA